MSALPVATSGRRPEVPQQRSFCLPRADALLSLGDREERAWTNLLTSRRTREVGIRMALGAQRSDVIRLVLKKAAFLLAIGLVSGLVASWFATRAIQAFLFGVGRHDPMTILSVCALLAVSGLKTTQSASRSTGRGVTNLEAIAMFLGSCEIAIMRVSRLYQAR
jgi:ABC-type antimicrobial peptide transport system permease subunit